MAIDVQVVGTGDFLGNQRAGSPIQSYSITESATPIDASDSSGAIGSISFSAIENFSDENSAQLLVNDSIEFSDTYRGTTSGKITNVSSDNGVLSVNADSRLGLFVATRAVPPYNGTLSGAITMYLGLAGITSNFVVDPSLSGITVQLQGWYGDMWTMFKSMGPVFGFDIALVSNNIVFRNIRTRSVINYKNISERWTVQNTELARTIEVNYYNNTYVNGGLVYPYGGWNSEVPVYQVNAGEIIDIEIPIDVSLTSIVQPTAVDSVTRTYTAGSVYCIAGNDGLPLSAAWWTKYGGNLTVSIGEDTKTLVVKLTGASGTVADKYAPFRVAMTAGTSDSYSSLRLRGVGVAYEKKTLTVPTAVEDSKTANEVGVTIDNIFVDTENDAWKVAYRAVGRYSRPLQTIDVTATFVNKRGESGDASYPLVSDFESNYTTETVDQFEAPNLALTMDEFDAEQYALVADSFDNQSFGNVAGARVKYRNAFYRITSATFNESEISYSAEWDTTVDDFETSYAGLTVDGIDTYLLNRKLEDLDVVPLRPLTAPAVPSFTEPGITPEVNPDGVYPSLTTYPSSATYPTAT